MKNLKKLLVANQIGFLSRHLRPILSLMVTLQHSTLNKLCSPKLEYQTLFEHIMSFYVCAFAHAACSVGLKCFPHPFQ